MTERDYAKDREINEQLYKEGRYPHIENTNRKIDYDEFIALRYKFGLTINRVNSFHAQLERDLVKVKTGVSSNYLPMYIKAYTYLMNYRSEHDKSNLTLKDAESILVQMCLLTLSEKSSPKYSYDNPGPYSIYKLSNCILFFKSSTNCSVSFTSSQIFESFF